MAAYAAVLSLKHSIDQIQTHPSPPISLHFTQLQFLTEKLIYLQEFLENHSIDVEGLEGRIADAAYEAEDLIESHIVHQIQAANATNEGKFITFIRFFRGLCKTPTPSHEENLLSPIELYHGLEKVMQDLDLIKGDLVEIMKHKRTQVERNYSTPAGRPRSPPRTQAAMVGLDDILLEALDKLTGQQSSRQIIPIVGMGGIGKTTLAKNIYVNPLIVQHFDFRGWATISQEYDSKEILVEILVCLKTVWNKEKLGQMGVHELGEKLYKSLSGRRYLIVMDDMWSIEAWDRIKFFFPDYNDGSRIVITTRLSNLAHELSSSCGLEVGFLDEDNSWNLFRRSVFGEHDCPPDLEEIGLQISKNCKGLPLSIVVVGGLLAKSNQTQEHWQYIAENLNSVVNLDESERCLRILRLSYNHLPIHLKPCFLYLGIFFEDDLISASTLIKLWVAEGFLKPISDKTLELAGREYLKDLFERNLVIVHELGYKGNIKRFRIHDLVRDLCIKEAEKEMFFCVATTHGPNRGQIWHIQRRIGIHRRESSSSKHITSEEVRNIARSAKLARSLICNVDRLRPSPLLRVFHRNKPQFYYVPEYTYPLEDIFRLVNSRHLVVPAQLLKTGRLTPSFYHLWNLQTLQLDYVHFCPLLVDIWRMPRLRHVNIFKFHLADPPTSHDNPGVLWELQTLKTVLISNRVEEMVRRVPNLKKLNLKVPYTIYLSGVDYGLDSLCRLSKMESLCCSFYCAQDPVNHSHDLARGLVFPTSLKKLTLENASLVWDELAAKVGHLPHLQVLILRWDSCKGRKWVTVEGLFCSLKVLKIHSCSELVYWTMENWAHLPCLEQLVLNYLPNLKEIPLEIGNIPTMKSIVVNNCSDSAVMSAKEIAKEQEEIGNEDLRVRVVLRDKSQVLERLGGLASANFQVEI
ncbi:disease resistance protein [Striga asiatica]|uniref:Disease resistance protein n=1 Tax=Striga asiatica TaxID=4170 RepID=A0A5A7R6W9_STRAF|nr:disease resistance protein [Striga asiatica]